MPSRITSTHSGIADLVERQMRNWELARQQRLQLSEHEMASVEDFVCISRQVGTDGRRVADRVGRELGWPVFDREILDAMAGDDAIRRQVYESMDERDLGWWEEALRSLMSSEFVRNDYFRRLCETLLSLARQGNCVFLGRGADLILPDDRGFRARLVAPLAHRIEVYSRTRSLSAHEAERRMQRIESDRRRFFRRHFGVDIDDPVRYHMTINLSRCCVAEAAAMILQGRQIRGAST